jgi:hypothetical protein
MAKTNAERQAGWRMRQREKLDALEVQSMLESDLALAHIRIKALEDIIAADKEQLEAWRSARRSTGNPQFKEALRAMMDDTHAANLARDQALAERDEAVRRYDPEQFILTSELAEVLRESPSSNKRFLLNRAAGILKAATRRRNTAP